MKLPLQPRSIPAAICLVLLLSACVGGGKVPADHYYRLPDIDHITPLQRPLLEGSLLVEPFLASGMLDGRSLLYVDASRPNEVQRYYYRYWEDAPSRMVYGHFSDFLQKKGVAERLLTGGRLNQARAVLKPTLLRFERVVAGREGKATARVRVEIKFDYEDRLKNNASLSKTYTAELPVADGTIYTTVETFGAALEHIYSAWLADLQQALATGTGGRQSALRAQP